MTTTYDLTLLLDAEAPSERRTKILGDVEAAIAARGEVVSKHEWGVRALAYEIDHRPDAEYHLLQFQGSRELLESLPRSLRITDGILRFRIVKLPPNMPPPPQLRAEPRPAPAEPPVQDAAPEAAEPAAEAAAPPAAEPEPPAVEPAVEEVEQAPAEQADDPAATTADAD